MNKPTQFLLTAVLALGMVSCGLFGASDDEATATTLPEAGQVDNNPAVAQNTLKRAESYYHPGMKPDVLTVIEFNAPWCMPCKQFEPVFNQASAAYAGRAEFLSVDMDQHPDMAKAFGVTNIPCVVLIQPDGTLTKVEGKNELMPYDKFADLLKSKL